MRYYARKFAFYLVALWAALTLNFFIPRLMPGNPVDILMAKLAQRGGTVDPSARRAYELLLALVRRNGAVAGRNELLKEVWGYGAFIMTRTVDTHIAELRRKIEKNPAEPEHIVTVWKVGYRLASSSRGA